MAGKKATDAKKPETTEETPEKVDDGKKQISFRLTPEELGALSLLATLRGHASGPVGQNRLMVIKDAIGVLVDNDETLAPFEDRLSPLFILEDEE